MPKPLSLTFPYFFPSALYKQFHFQKKSLMKPDTFDFKPFHHSPHRLDKIYHNFHKKIFNET